LKEPLTQIWGAEAQSETDHRREEM